MAPFLRGEAAEPDLSLLGALDENPAELGRFDTLLAEGRRITSTVGSDSHENVVAGKFRDGERGDSYRRTFRWFGNYLLVADLSPDTIKDALVRGRAFGAFHVMGDPVGFDYHTEAGGEMGDRVARGSVLIVDPPQIVPAPGQPAPTVKLRILRAEGTKAVEVASGDGATPLRFTASAPGAYRAEVRMVPHHLTGYMGMLQAKLLRDLVYIYANPIYVD
jgi:hypothetical protein